MSYCLNPTCQHPQNLGDAELCESCGSQLLLTPYPKASQASRYRTIKPIGQGGFGRTFLAVDETKPQMVSQCVIKQSLPQKNPAEKADRLFHQEAAQLQILGKQMFSLVWFIFGSQIVIFNAMFALTISAAFMFVKYQLSQNKEFANNNLFASLVLLFLMAGSMGNSRILNTGIFGFLLACLVVASPLFFIKENYQ